MKVIYGRISSTLQNEARQLEKGEISFIDKCSGAVPFMERPQAKRLLDHLKDNPKCETEILSVDRIGRSTLDILQTIQFFKQKGYVLKIKNLGYRFLPKLQILKKKSQISSLFILELN